MSDCSVLSLFILNTSSFILILIIQIIFFLLNLKQQKLLTTSSLNLQLYILYFMFDFVVVVDSFQLATPGIVQASYARPDSVLGGRPSSQLQREQDQRLKGELFKAL